jgi:DNA polymerase I-like protein with 3'-5' exonuclease and polymerase domains
MKAIAPVTKRSPELEIEVLGGETIPYAHGDSIIFCLGDLCKPFLQEIKALPKNRTTASLRNQLWKLPETDCQLMFSYGAGIGDIDYAKHIDLLCDTGMAMRYALTGSLAAKMGNYRYVPDFAETIAAIDKMYDKTNKPVPVELDLETIGMDPYALPTADHPGARIVSIQLTYDDGMADVVYFHSREDEEKRLGDFQFMLDLSHILNSPKISLGGANLKFDLHWIARRAKLKCSNFKFDTTLVGSMLDENRSNGLDVHAKIYVPALGGYSDQFDLSVDKSRMDLVPPEKLLPYAGGDTDACHQVRKAMTAELLADPAATAFYVNILHPAARAFEEVEQGGVLVDMDAYKELEADLLSDMTTHVKKAKAMMGGRLCIKHHDPKQELGLNLTKASLLKDFMFSPMGLNLKPKMMTEKSGEPSTAMEHLLMFEDDPAAKEFVSIIKAYASASKTMSTYVRGFQKHIRSDGKFHPSYWFFVGKKDEDEGGTNTGRLSCKDPAFQTIPKHTAWGKRIRRCFPAPPGYVVCERDYSQGELKVIACVANEENMIQAYLQDMDLHSLTAGPFRGYEYEDMMAMKAMEDTNPELFHLFEEIRQLGKAGNFGLIYGMGADGFYDYAINNYGVKNFFRSDADKFRTGFFLRYPQLPDYHDEYKKFARKNGFVRSPLGRVRHLPLINSPMQDIRAKAERQAINAPIQGTLSDMLLWSAAIAQANGWTEVCPAFGAIHDALYNYIPEDNVEMYVKRELDSMQNLPFHKVGWKPRLVFTADAKIGKNMADLKKLKLAA